MVTRVFLLGGAKKNLKLKAFTFKLVQDLLVLQLHRLLNLMYQNTCLLKIKETVANIKCNFLKVVTTFYQIKMLVLLKLHLLCSTCHFLFSCCKELKENKIII